MDRLRLLMNGREAGITAQALPLSAMGGKLAKETKNLENFWGGDDRDYFVHIVVVFIGADLEIWWGNSLEI